MPDINETNLEDSKNMESTGTEQNNEQKEKDTVFKKNKKDDNVAAEITELTKQLDELKAQLDSEKESKLRIMAEYDNFRKRTAKEKADIYPDAVASTALSFLPVLDNFERALAFETADTEYKKGFEMIFNQLNEAFTKLSIEQIGTVGETFDPNLHNAVMHIEDENFDENTICEVFQKGYKMGDKVIRCAMVKVAN